MANNEDIRRLYMTHYARMHRLAMVIVHDDDLARDIVNDVFTSLLKRESSEAVTPGYLMSSVRNRCLNHLRDADVRSVLANQYPLDVAEIIDEETWPDEETISLLNRLIDTNLSPQCRRVLELRYVDGLSYAEIGQSLGISKVAVYKHLRHALETLRSKMM